MLPTCNLCGLSIDYDPEVIGFDRYHYACATIKEKEMNTQKIEVVKKISLVEKISKNRKLIVKRTLQVGVGIAGVLFLSSFLSKKRFVDEDDNLIVVDVDPLEDSENDRDVE